MITFSQGRFEKRCWRCPQIVTQYAKTADLKWFSKYDRYCSNWSNLILCTEWTFPVDNNALIKTWNTNQVVQADTDSKNPNNKFSAYVEKSWFIIDIITGVKRSMKVTGLTDALRKSSLLFDWTASQIKSIPGNQDREGKKISQNALATGAAITLDWFMPEQWCECDNSPKVNWWHCIRDGNISFASSVDYLRLRTKNSSRLEVECVHVNLLKSSRTPAFTVLRNGIRVLFVTIPNATLLILYLTTRCHFSNVNQKTLAWGSRLSATVWIYFMGNVESVGI